MGAQLSGDALRFASEFASPLPPACGGAAPERQWLRRGALALEAAGLAAAPAAAARKAANNQYLSGGAGGGSSGGSRIGALLGGLLGGGAAGDRGATDGSAFGLAGIDEFIPPAGAVPGAAEATAAAPTAGGAVAPPKDLLDVLLGHSAATGRLAAALDSAAVALAEAAAAAEAGGEGPAGPLALEALRWAGITPEPPAGSAGWSAEHRERVERGAAAAVRLAQFLLAAAIQRSGGRPTTLAAWLSRPAAGNPDGAGPAVAAAPAVTEEAEAPRRSVIVVSEAAHLEGAGPVAGVAPAAPQAAGAETAAGLEAQLTAVHRLHGVAAEVFAGLPISPTASSGAGAAPSSGGARGRLVGETALLLLTMHATALQHPALDDAGRPDRLADWLLLGPGAPLAGPMLRQAAQYVADWGAGALPAGASLPGSSCAADGSASMEAGRGLSGWLSTATGGWLGSNQGTASTDTAVAVDTGGGGVGLLSLQLCCALLIYRKPTAPVAPAVSPPGTAGAAAEPLVNAAIAAAQRWRVCVADGRPDAGSDVDAAAGSGVVADPRDADVALFSLLEVAGRRSRQLLEFGLLIYLLLQHRSVPTFRLLPAVPGAAMGLLEAAHAAALGITAAVDALPPLATSPAYVPSTVSSVAGTAGAPSNPNAPMQGTIVAGKAPAAFLAGTTLLCMSRDRSLVEAWFATPAATPGWFRDGGALGPIDIGSLLLLVATGVVRAAMRVGAADLAEVFMSLMANVSPVAAGVHSRAAQRMAALLKRLLLSLRKLRSQQHALESRAPSAPPAAAVQGAAAEAAAAAITAVAADRREVDEALAALRSRVTEDEDLLCVLLHALHNMVGLGGTAAGGPPAHGAVRGNEYVVYELLHMKDEIAAASQRPAPSEQPEHQRSSVPPSQTGPPRLTSMFDDKVAAPAGSAAAAALAPVAKALATVDTELSSVSRAHTCADILDLIRRVATEHAAPRVVSLDGAAGRRAAAEDDELLFEYTEDDAAYDFFAPLLWSLVVGRPVSRAVAPLAARPQALEYHAPHY